MSLVLLGSSILLLTLFLDALELSFKRILWFTKTLRFWLYFVLHFGISCLAAYLLHTKLTEWFILAPAATILGVGVISNTNVKLAGVSIVPVADLFTSTKAQMIAQAGEDKATELRKAQLIQRLRKLSSEKLQESCIAALLAGGKTADYVNAKIADAKAASHGDDGYFKNSLIKILIKTNLDFAEKNVENWEQKD